jgi:uncharacterized protein (DUF488 family)
VQLVTVGHGTATADVFSELLTGAGVACVVDVRTTPRSRRHPHFAGEAMKRWLPDAGIAYRWEKALGGFRRPRPDSPHIGLRHEGFRGYADYMETAEFGAALDRLVEVAQEGLTAVMCAESVWWRCHRRLLADALVAQRGIAVEHLFHDGRLTTHELSASARLEVDRLIYDVGETPALDL